MDNAADRCGRANTHAWSDREGLQELAVNTHSRHGVNNKTKQADKKHRHPTSIFSFGLCGYHGKNTETWHLEKNEQTPSTIPEISVCVYLCVCAFVYQIEKLTICLHINMLKYQANVYLLYKSDIFC